MEHDASVLSALTRMAPLRTRSEVLARPSPVPREGGVYGWYFRRAPAGVPLDGCIERDGHVLLYVGISPSSPPSKTKPCCQRVFLNSRPKAGGISARM